MYKPWYQFTEAFWENPNALGGALADSIRFWDTHGGPTDASGDAMFGPSAERIMKDNPGISRAEAEALAESFANDPAAYNQWKALHGDQGGQSKDPFYSSLWAEAERQQRSTEGAGDKALDWLKNAADKWGGQYGDLLAKVIGGGQSIWDAIDSLYRSSSSNQYDPRSLGMTYDMLWGSHGIGNPEFRDEFLADLPGFYEQYLGRHNDPTISGDAMSFDDWYQEIMGGIGRDNDAHGGAGTGSANEGDDPVHDGPGGGGDGDFPDWSGMQKPGLIDPYGGKSTADFWGPQMGGAFPTMNWWDVGYQSGPYENDMYFNPIDFGTPQGQGPVGGGGMPPDFMAMLMSMLGGHGGGR